MVVSWISHSVCLAIYQIIIFMDKAIHMWKDLKTRFSQADLLRIFYIQKEIYSICKGDLTIMNYFTQLHILQDELENFRLDLVCGCAILCSCNALVNAKTQKSQDQVIQFLKGLNGEYTTVKTQILIIDPLPPINKLFALVAQQEHQLSSSNHGILANVATAERFQSHGRGPGHGG